EDRVGAENELVLLDAEAREHVDTDACVGHELEHVDEVERFHAEAEAGESGRARMRAEAGERSHAPFRGKTQTCLKVAIQPMVRAVGACRVRVARANAEA